MNTGSKFYLCDGIQDGRCCVFHPSDNSAYTLTVPIQTVPYLGVLVSKGYHIGTCAILEPCTGAFDRPDRARAFGRNSVLRAKGSYSWYLEFMKVGEQS